MTTNISKPNRKMLIAAATVFIYAVLYFTLQQIIRSSANDAPMQYAVDIRSAMEGRGNAMEQLLRRKETTDLADNPVNFITVYDKEGNALFSTTMLHGAIPVIPKGALDHAQKTGINKISWQPVPGIRYATIILPYSTNANSGYVAAGNSLKRFEQQISLAQKLTGIFLLASFLAIFIPGSNPVIMVHF